MFKNVRVGLLIVMVSLSGAPKSSHFTGGTAYVDGTRHSREECWYEFLCASEWRGEALSDAWMGLADRDPVTCNCASGTIS